VEEMKANPAVLQNERMKKALSHTEDVLRHALKRYYNATDYARHLTLLKEKIKYWSDEVRNANKDYNKRHQGQRANSSRPHQHKGPPHAQKLGMGHAPKHSPRRRSHLEKDSSGVVASSCFSCMTSFFMNKPRTHLYNTSAKRRVARLVKLFSITASHTRLRNDINMPRFGVLLLVTPTKWDQRLWHT